MGMEELKGTGSGPGRETWPNNVRPMTVDALGDLGYDPEGDLYWKGKRIEVRKSLTFTKWQKAGTVIVTVSAAVAALASAASAYVDWQTANLDNASHVEVSPNSSGA